MTAGIGTVSEIVDGVYTGQLAGPFCYAEGKVEAIEELARWEGFDLGQCYAYSDSASDLPMLAAPSATRSRSTRTRSSSASPTGSGWPMVIFSQRTKAVVRRSHAGRRRHLARRRLVRRRHRIRAPAHLTRDATLEPQMLMKAKLGDSAKAVSARNEAHLAAQRDQASLAVPQLAVLLEQARGSRNAS